MSAPTIKRASAKLTYTGSDGYRSEVSYSSTACPADKPQMALLGAFEELSRILHLFGHGEEAMRVANEAGDRVKEFFAERIAKAKPGTTEGGGAE